MLWTTCTLHTSKNFAESYLTPFRSAWMDAPMCPIQSDSGSNSDFCTAIQTFSVRWLIDCKWIVTFNITGSLSHVIKKKAIHPLYIYIASAEPNSPQSEHFSVQRFNCLILCVHCTSVQLWSLTLIWQYLHHTFYTVWQQHHIKMCGSEQ